MNYGHEVIKNPPFEIPTKLAAGNTPTVWRKIPANAFNRHHHREIAGLVIPDSQVPPYCRFRTAKPFEVLTQTKAYSNRGADMGRPNAGTKQAAGVRIFDRVVTINSQGYDQGGAYWGTGRRLRVRYTKDLSYVRFYRETFEYNVYGDYGYGPEVLTCESNMLEARARLNEYRENEPGNRFWVKKERVLPD